jgi:phosphatidylglycerophosphate synthase
LQQILEHPAKTLSELIMVHESLATPLAPPVPPRRRPVILRYGAAAAANLVLVGCAAAILGPSGAISSPLAAMAVFAIAAIWAGTALAETYPHSTLGLANLVTLARLALAASLVATLAHPEGLAGSDTQAWAVMGIAMLTLCLDGLDGRLARLQHLTSDFGARFDMEVDGFFAALLAVMLFLSGKIGIWALPLGFMRYGFLAAAALLPWLRAPLPDRFRRKAVCVLQIGTLVLLLAPPIGPGVAWAPAALATAALVWSFAIDIAWLWRNRA